MVVQLAVDKSSTDEKREDRDPSPMQDNLQVTSLYIRSGMVINTAGF